MIGRRTLVKALGAGAAAVCGIGMLPRPAARATDGWSWAELTPAAGPAPAPRANGTAIHDPRANRVIVFGGAGADGNLDDLWAFDLAGGTWTAIDTGGGPAARLGHDAVYDPAGHQMVVWGGQQGSRFFNDTWLLDLESLAWRDVSPARRPNVRYGSASVYDPAGRRLVMFAGFTDQGRFQDTQAFDLATNTWENLTPPGAKPQVRCLLTAALDREGRRMIVYAGQRTGALDDLWAFDLTTHAWADLTPAVRPPGRFFSTSFVNRAGRFVIFGGRTNAGNVNDVWAFDLAAGMWTPLDVPGPPAPRSGMMAAYVEADDRLIVIGGSGAVRSTDVWELRPGAAA